jgi:hypothetical protein
MSDSMSGPHLSAAFLCEKVLREGDGVLSFVRVVDRFIRPRPSAVPKGAQILPIQVMLVASFKSGGLPTGPYKVKTRLHKPESTGSPLFETDNDVFVEGGEDQGFALVNPLVMNPEEQGLYWIDVLFEDRMVTRIPFRILFVSPGNQAALPGGA